MATFPNAPLEYEVELYLNGSWRNVTSDVLKDAAINIKRGRSDQSAAPQVGSTTFNLLNTSGDYSPRWPTGQWYGYIGQNTPVRVGNIRSKDTFTRTVSNGWGSDDTGDAWTSGGVGGTVAAGDHNVGSGVGTQSVPATNAYRYDYLSSVSYRTIDVRADVSLSFTNVTGASLYPCGIMLRGVDTSNYYLVRVEITAAEAVTIGIFKADGTTIAAAVTVSGLTHTSSQTLRVRAQAEGHTLRGKVWAASGSEPFGWHVSAHDETWPDAGFVGIRSGVQTGNTNTLPVVFSIDNVYVKSPLCATEISDMPASWDTSGRYVIAAVTAGGPLRRLGKGQALQSTFRRGYLRDLTYTPLIYWPCEDSATLTNYFAPAIGQLPLWINSGSPKLATLTPFDCSSALPGINLSSWWGQIPPYTAGSNTCQIRFLVSIPSGGLGLGQRRLMMVTFAGGTIGNISCFVDQSGNVAINVYDTNATVIHIGASVAAGLNGVPEQLAIEFQQNTSTLVKINVISLAPGAGSVIELGTTNVLGSQTLGVATSITVDPDVLLPDTVAMGHISFHTTNQTLLNLSSQLNAWKAETAGARASRLTTEERLAFSYVGTLSDSEQMGPQRPIELQKLIYACQAADLGELYESRGEFGIVYRPRSGLFNQTATATFNYQNHELKPPFQGTNDDKYLKNDVTVTREGGSSWRSTLDVGRLSTLPPELGGSGRYDQTLTVNVYSDTQLPDLSGWLLHLGTVDESRYAVINLDLANLHITSAQRRSILDLDIGDRIVITNPKSGQEVNSISQIITGVEITCHQYKFEVKLNCVPESPYQVGVLDDTNKRFDSDNTTLTSSLNSSATSFQVSIATDSALWTTAAGDMPISITIDGEIMSVGAVSGASSPQTFSSVTRSVNGVVKAHSAGAQVHVAYPFYLS